MDEIALYNDQLDRPLWASHNAACTAEAFVADMRVPIDHGDGFNEAHAIEADLAADAALVDFHFDAGHRPDFSANGGTQVG